jgi:hypothetical protein
MKFARFLVVLAVTGVAPVLLMPAAGQQEIDPDHFENPIPAKTVQSAAQPKASPKPAALKSQSNSVGKASRGQQTKTHARQLEAEKRNVAVVHSTPE